jgi:hypothetical protein
MNNLNITNIITRQKNIIIQNDIIIKQINNIHKIKQIKNSIQLQKINKQNKYTAIIVEPRKHAALLFVLENFLKNLSSEWNIIIFHGRLNSNYVNNIIVNNLHNYKERISTINLNINNLKPSEYSFLFKQLFFYNKIPTETFLVFQTDTIIFEKNKDLINNFLKYDYVGAPWDLSPTSINNFVGNGGLSLRKKSKMLEIIKKDIDIINIAEDVYFSCSNKVQLFKPSQQEAKLFSVEYMFSKNTFGSHKPWIIQKEHPEFYTLYPESNILEKLQYVIN